MRNLFIALAMFFGVAFATTTAKANAPVAPAATYGNYFNQQLGVWNVGYYCPIGYRLVYGQFLQTGWYWNGFQYVYGTFVSYGYYCVYP
jgi:hypothetical protein